MTVKKEEVFNIIQYAFNDPEKSGYCRPRELQDGDNLREPEIDDNDFPIYYDVSKKFAALLVGAHPDRYHLFESDTVTVKYSVNGAMRYKKANSYSYRMKKVFLGLDSENNEEYKFVPEFFHSKRGSFFAKDPVVVKEVVQETVVDTEAPLLPVEPVDHETGKGVVQPVFKTGNQLLKEVRAKALDVGIPAEVVKGIEVTYRAEIKKKTGNFSGEQFPVIIKLFEEAITDHVTA